MADPLKAQRDLLDIVNGQIRKQYNGDPMGLETFVSGVEIAKDFANTAALQTKLVVYVKGRLEGKARELITNDIQNIDQLIEKLKENIQPENAKIIEGRIASLRYSYARQEEFAAKTEELADALRRTLIIEGMTPEKANDMTIERTIQLCRKSTNSDVVKAVLTAATFKTAKEVVAKLITSNDECVKEKQVLRYQKDGNRGHRRGGFDKGRGNQVYRNNQGYRGGRKPFNNYSSYNSFENNSYRGRGGFRGRGNYSGRQYNANNRYQGQQNSGGWQWNRSQNVRLAQSGNASVPQAIMGGPIVRQIE